MDRNKITISVPGKLLLFGEHAVVYGHSCVSSTVNQRLQVTVEINREKDQLDIPQKTDTRFLLSALEIFRSRYNINTFVTVTTGDQLTGYGLGSSSAVTVGVIRGLAELFGIKLSHEELFDLAYQAILKIQKIASGFDVATSVWGGTILFDGQTKSVQTISSVQLPIMVIYSGKKADTVKLVRQVAEFIKRNPEQITGLFSQIQSCVSDGADAVRTNDWKKLGETMTENHHLLQKLQVSTPKINSLVEEAISAGAYGAKLSGAGGGDCVIALVSDRDRKRISDAVTKVGGIVLDLAVGIP